MLFFENTAVFELLFGSLIALMLGSFCSALLKIEVFFEGFEIPRWVRGRTREDKLGNWGGPLWSSSWSSSRSRRCSRGALVLFLRCCRLRIAQWSSLLKVDDDDDLIENDEGEEGDDDRYRYGTESPQSLQAHNKNKWTLLFFYIVNFNLIQVSVTHLIYFLKLFIDTFSRKVC